MNWKPNKWIAGILTLVVVSIGFLYIGRAKFALILLVLNLALSFVGIFYMPDWFILVIWLIYLGFAIYVFNQARIAVVKRPFYSKWYGMIFVVLVVGLPLYAVRVFYFEPFYIPSESMSPTLNVGNYIVIKKQGCGNYKLFGIIIHKTVPSDDCEINRGDVIVFEYPEDKKNSYIQRVIGIEGDMLSYKNKVLTINNKVVERANEIDKVKFKILTESLGKKSYKIKHQNHNYGAPGGDWTVPYGYYFVLGDNRDNSSDSRVWGFVPKENFIGKLYHIF